MASSNKPDGMNLSKFKKNELVDLADKLKLSTSGVKSDLESRISEYVDQQGGWESVASSGKLSDHSWLQQLDITVHHAAQKIISPVKKASVKAAGKINAVMQKEAEKCEAWYCTIYQQHSPMRLFDAVIGHLDHHFSVKQVFEDLRSKFASADTVVMLLIYVEFALLVWSQVGWSVRPLYSVTMPHFMQGVLHKDHAVLNLRMPLLSGLLNRKSFLYPAFYWFVYFVAIPTVAGWLVNMSSRAGKVICPINMLTFSWVRLVVFWWCVVGAISVDGLLSGVPVTTCHTSLTVLFDGAHLPLKLFLTTCFSGLVYASYEKHDD